MKRSLTTLLCILITCLAFSQDKFDFDFTKDYDSILRMTKDNTSKSFYDDLFERYQKADFTLTNYELLALQIGYTDNPKYYPYQDIELEEEIWDLNEKKEFELAEKKLDTLLSNNPFNILGLREMKYVQNKLGNSERAELLDEQYQLIVGSILSTGDGNSYDSSWFILSPNDGQWIIKHEFQQSICSMSSGKDDNGNFHEILGKENKDSEECENLYFNLEPANKRMYGKGGFKKKN